MITINIELTSIWVEYELNEAGPVQKIFGRFTTSPIGKPSSSDPLGQGHAVTLKLTQEQASRLVVGRRYDIQLVAPDEDKAPEHIEVTPDMIRAARAMWREEMGSLACKVDDKVWEKVICSAFIAREMGWP